MHTQLAWEGDPTPLPGSLLGLTDKPVSPTGGVLEAAALLALVVYLALGLLVRRLLWGPSLVSRRHWTVFRH